MKTASLFLATIVAASAVAFTTPKGKVEIGSAAPTFEATDTNGKAVKLDNYRGKYVVLEWCNFTCPFVKKHYGSGNMQALQKKYTQKGVVWLTIFSSAEGKEGYYSSAQLNDFAKEKKMSSTLVVDADGAIGHLYGAKNTPTMFVIDPSGKTIYKGGIDDTPTPDPADIPKSKNYVSAALDEALAGKSVTTPVSRPYGCSVKYKDAN